jgi:hypothetical protein
MFERGSRRRSAGPPHHWRAGAGSRLGALPQWALTDDSLCSLARTDDELSIVCAAVHVPAECRAERGWAVIKLLGPFPFDAIGVLASFAQPLAAAGVSLFALSTFDTDYILVKRAELGTAVVALTRAGHEEATV